MKGTIGRSNNARELGAFSDAETIVLLLAGPRARNAPNASCLAVRPTVPGVRPNRLLSGGQSRRWGPPPIPNDRKRLGELGRAATPWTAICRGGCRSWSSPESARHQSQLSQLRHRYAPP